MNHDELVTRAKAILADAYEEAAMMIALYLEAHESEQLQPLCKEIDPENWNALRNKVQRAQGNRKANRGADTTRARTIRRLKQTLRETSPEAMAEVFSEPAVRANVSQAQDIAHRQVEQKSRAAQREALGSEVDDALNSQQRWHDAEAELFKSRRALIETLRILNEAGIENLPDSWREEFLRTFDDITTKADIGRSLLVGALDEELDKLLEA